MDRTSWIAIIACMALLVFYRPIVNYFYPPDPNAVPAGQANQVSPTQAAAPVTQTAPTNTPNSELSFRPIHTKAEVEKGLPKERRLMLSNDFITAEFTTHGGAVRRVILKKHEAEGNERVTLNRGAELPMLNLSGWLGDVSIMGYEVLEQTSDSISFVRQLDEDLRLIRRYTLSENYSIKLEQIVENNGSRTAKLSSYWLQVGIGAPVYLKPTVRRYFAGGWFTTTGKHRSTALPTFDDGRFLFLWPTKGKLFVNSKLGELIYWASAKSQFFATVLSTLDQPSTGVDLRKVPLTNLHEEGGWIPDGVQAQLQMPGLTVAPGSAVAQKFNLYTGPKQDSLLASLPFEQNRVMQFGWLGFIVRPMLWVMNFINQFVHNYGVTIIILTILIKAALWAPQSKANLSMKRMQLLSPKLKKLQDKYADTPQRLQEEMMRLYKEYNVNPLGGCLPLLVQMPIFIGFYYMLLSAVELRHASFLWITDLSQPDTVLTLPIFEFEIPINPMPLIMAATMFWSMNITPQPKGVDNPTLKMMKFMPLVILLICYNFGAALSLYWTVQNILSAAQMYYNLKQPMPKLEKVAVVDSPKPKLSSPGGGFFSTLHQASQNQQKKGKKKKRR